MRKITVSAVAGVLVVGVVVALVVATRPRDEAATDLTGAIFLDPSYSPEERAADLVSRMTLVEKASQMVSSQAPAIPRLRVRAYSWWNEAIHGVAREGRHDAQNPDELVNTTSYPVSLSLGSTWNPELVHEVASAIADEAREVVRDNTLDLDFYSPTVNLARDPRWGRNDETYSEDPLLTAAIATQYVNGMEGKDLDGVPLPEGGGYLKTATTLKHYAANNSEVNRRTGSSDMDERTLREYYTAQFRSIVRAADPASIMTAYNEVNGVPGSANVHLLETLGRQTFGFDGYYTSDCDSIYEMQRGHAWVPPDADGPVDAVSRHAHASAAGVDLNCQLGYHDDHSYATELPAAVEQRIRTELGTFTEANLDVSLARLFAVRMRLGEFDDPGTVPWVVAARSRVPAGTWSNIEDNDAVTQTPERLDLARRAADESIVLLRNNGLLPLRVPATGAYRLAVVGPAADPGARFLGGYSSVQGIAGIANEVTPFDGIAAAVRAVNPTAVVDLLTGDDVPDRVGAYDAVVLALGTDHTIAAEDTDRADLVLPDGQAELAAQVAAHNPATVVSLETVGQVDIGALAGVPALLWSSYNGQRGGQALADVLFGRTSPSGRLPFTWYADGASLPAIEDYGIRAENGSPGRTYEYYTGPVAFGFGHGLGYAAMAYGPPGVDRTAASPDDTVTVSVDVTNTGGIDGAEVVQLYVASPPAPQVPVRRLAGFTKATLAPGQTTSLRFDVRIADLAFFDETAGRFVVEPGTYRFEVAASSMDIRGTAAVEVAGDLTAVPVTVTARPVSLEGQAAGVINQLVFPVDAAVQPRLTVAMSDDTLYSPVPDGMSVVFESNRPGIVGVEPGGGIRTHAPGVATVTASVTAAGVTARTSFVVVVA